MSGMKWHRVQQRKRMADRGTLRHDASEPTLDRLAFVREVRAAVARADVVRVICAACGHEGLCRRSLVATKALRCSRCGAVRQPQARSHRRRRAQRAADRSNK